MRPLYRPLKQCILCRSAALDVAVPLAPMPIATPTFAVPEHLRGKDEAFAAAPLDLGQRWEPLVDRHLVATAQGAVPHLHPPRRAEVVLVTDAPWEGPTSAYFTVLKDGEVIRLYYRGSVEGSDHSDAQVTCVAESRDGVHFTRPRLGLVEVNGSRDNNVVWRGVESHNFAPFLDTNPAAAPDARYKALGGVKQPGRNWQQGATPGGLYAFASADGIRWRKLRDEPVLTQGAFDSLNLAFWDAARGSYACYSRIFVDKVRAQAIGANVIKSVTPGQMVVKIVNDVMVETLGSDADPINLDAAPPVAIMMVGLQGAGKTTTTAKIAKRLKERHDKRVLMASLDVKRPAAQEQLAVLGRQIGIETLPIIPGQTPVQIAQRAEQAARLQGYDVVMLDKIGRAHD